MAKRQARQTKEKILDAALEVFAAHGYHDASIDEIAARAGVTKGAVYYWFEDKDDLALDLHNRVWVRLAGLAEAAVDPNADVSATLRQGFDAFLRALGNAGSARFFLRDIAHIPAIEAASRGVAEQARALIKGYLDRGIARGELAEVNADAMARVLIGAYNEATLYVLETGDEDGARAVISRVVDAFAQEEQQASARR
ncbi:MAG: TetR/AcrR family transcriptional regulator [Actinomycetota bacterium]